MTWLNKRGVRLAVTTLLYLGLLGFAPFVVRFQEHRAIPAVAFAQLGMDVLTAFIYACAILAVFTLRHKAAVVLLPLLFAATALANDFILHFRINLTTDIVGAVWEATPEEILSYSNFALLTYAAFSIAFAFLILKWLKATPPQDVHTRLGFICGVFMLGVLLGDDGGMGEQYLPFSLLKNGYRYALSHWHGAERTDISNAEFSWQKPAEGPVIVMVIGESARADHFSLNGYKRKTNPLLEKEKNLVSFHHVTSCTALTRTAVPCMLTRKTLAEAAGENLNITLPETSVISIFRRLGFDTFWIGVQGTHAFTDSPFVWLMAEAQHYVLLNSYLFLRGKLDEEALPYLDTFLAQSDSAKFLVIHTFGSHWPYTNRYPDTFRKFEPVCRQSSAWSNFFALDTAMKECDVQQPGALVNAYDNSILYTDYFLATLIERLKNRNALLLYVSDHGQSLGEDGYYLHGNMSRKEQRQVAMIAWASDHFIHQHAQAWRQLQRHRNAFLSHDYIFHSLLDCAGIESPVINPSLSLCRPYDAQTSSH